MPYAWIQESVVFDEDTANSIKGISAAVAFAYDVQLWCFVSGGVLPLILPIRCLLASLIDVIFAAICALMYGKKVFEAESDPRTAYIYSTVPSSESNNLVQGLVSADRTNDVTEGLSLKHNRAK